MYSLVRRFIKTAIVFLGVGLTIGLWIMVRREIYGRFPGPYEVSAHTHAILVGFVMMMILGVALWLFPCPQHDDVPYQPASLASASFSTRCGRAFAPRGAGRAKRRASASSEAANTA